MTVPKVLEKLVKSESDLRLITLAQVLAQLEANGFEMSEYDKGRLDMLIMTASLKKKECC